MASASGIGATVDLADDCDAVAALFGEDQGRYVVTMSKDSATALAAANGVNIVRIGTTGGSSLKLGRARAIPVVELKEAHEGWFPTFMG